MNPNPISSFCKKRYFGKRSASGSSVVNYRTRRAVHMYSCGQDSCPCGELLLPAGLLSLCRGRAAPSNLFIVHFGTKALCFRVFVSLETKMPERTCKCLERDILKGLGHGTNSNTI